MRRSIRSGLAALAALAALGVVACAQSASAQALGPQRQFLALEPYYEHTQFDVGENLGKQSRDGYGGRLWINTDPFHFIPNGSIALFTTYAPKTTSVAGVRSSALTYGLEYDQFLVRRPLGGVIDPFLTIGGAAYRIGTEVGTRTVHSVYGALIPGGGIRIPIPNRFELRGDVKDLILFNQARTTTGARRTTHNLLLQAGLGLTF